MTALPDSTCQGHDVGLSHVDYRPPPAAPGTRIGLLGGSFNPAHVGHRHISLWAIRRLRLDQLWWIVTPGNPIKDQSDLAPLPERVRQARTVGRHPKIRVTAFESTLGTAYTAATLRFLRRHYPRVRFVWIMGADNLAGFPAWRDWRRIFAMMPICVIDRPGWRFRALSGTAARAFSYARCPESSLAGLPSRAPPAWGYMTLPLAGISSTQIRRGELSGRISTSDAIWPYMC